MQVLLLIVAIPVAVMIGLVVRVVTIWLLGLREWEARRYTWTNRQ